MINSGIEYELLNKFVGNWNTEGEIIASDAIPAIKISGTDTYEWLPGKFFLLHRVNVFIGKDKNETLEIIGYDKLNDFYTIQYFDNKGNSGFMKAICKRGLWNFIGETIRFSGTFKNEGNEFSGKWEQLSESKIWVYFMNIKLTRDLS